MKVLLTILFAALAITATCQTEPKLIKLRLDTCTNAEPRMGASTITGNPVCIANGIIVNPADVNPDSVLTYEIVTCPESFKRYKYIGSQGAIVMNSEQSFAYTTPEEIKQSKKIPGEVIFAINSLPLSDPILKISPGAITNVEITSAADPSDGKTIKNCINIWTIRGNNR